LHSEAGTEEKAANSASTLSDNVVVLYAYQQLQQHTVSPAPTLPVPATSADEILAAICRDVAVDGPEDGEDLPNPIVKQQQQALSQLQQCNPPVARPLPEDGDYVAPFAPCSTTVIGEDNCRTSAPALQLNRPSSQDAVAATTASSRARQPIR
jgi:hypothetical protein